MEFCDSCYYELDDYCDYCHDAYCSECDNHYDCQFLYGDDDDDYPDHEDQE